MKSLLFKLINNATYVYAIVILYDQSQIHLSRGRGLQMGWVFNKEVYARLHADSKFNLDFLFHVPIAIVTSK